MMLPLLVLLLLPPEPHRALKEATLQVAQRSLSWTFAQCYEDDKGNHHILLHPPLSKVQKLPYTLDFSRAALSYNKRSKALARDRSDMAEIVMTRVLLPYISRVYDECHVKDTQVWKAISIDAVNSAATVEFSGRRHRPLLNYRGEIRCDSYDVGLDAEDTAVLNVAIRSFLTLLIELTEWFDEVGNIASMRWNVSWTGQ